MIGKRMIEMELLLRLEVEIDVVDATDVECDVE